MAEVSTEKDSSAWSKLKGWFTGDRKSQAQVRPMTTEEKAQVTRRVMQAEEDPERRDQLARIGVRLRRKAAREKSFRKKAALTAAAVGTGVLMATAPTIGQGVSKVGEAVGGAAQAVGERVEQSLNSLEPSIEAGKKTGEEFQRARQKDQEVGKQQPTPQPTPPLWERTAVPKGQKPTPQVRIDPSKLKQT